MSQIEPMDSERAYKSLVSSECPGCGAKKSSGNSLCRECYFKLSPAQRKALYERMGSGYEEAIAAALDTLGVGSESA